MLSLLVEQPAIMAVRTRRGMVREQVDLGQRMFLLPFTGLTTEVSVDLCMLVTAAGCEPPRTDSRGPARLGQLFRRLGIEAGRR